MRLSAAQRSHLYKLLTEKIVALSIEPKPEQEPVPETTVESVSKKSENE